MRYIFAGGGTGGHIFPAIAIADEIKKIDKESEILFIGARGRIEEKIVPANNYKLETIDITGIERGVISNNILLPYKFIAALRRCRKIMKEFRPDIVTGTGGYVSGPVIFTASGMKIPTLIQEGNSFPGKTTKFLSPRASKVVINFDETRNYLKRKDNIIKISHPVRRSLKQINKEEALKYYGLPLEGKTIFTFGGSQGARGINNGFEKIIKSLYEKKLNIIWQTGKDDFERLKNEFAHLNDRVKIFDFIDNIEYAYCAGDLIICRAGITSIMEIACLGLVSILIPLPTSAENHQELNARSLEKGGAARMILQNDIEKKLMNEISDLLTDEDKLKNIRSRVGNFADPKAAEKIAAEVITLAEDYAGKNI